MHRIKMKFQNAEGNCGSSKNSQRALSMTRTRSAICCLLDNLESPRYKLKVMCSILVQYIDHMLYIYEILIFIASNVWL